METASLTSPSHHEKRLRILDAARKRMFHYGISKTTMSEIAEDTQMAVGTIYLYFKNKDEIALAIAQECRREQDEFLQSILQNEGLTPLQKLETFFVEKYRFMQAFKTETPHGKTLIAYLIQAYPELSSDWQMRFQDAIASILKQGQAKGNFVIDDADEAARTLRIATMGFFPPPYIDLPLPPDENDLLHMIRWFCRIWQCK